MKHACTMVMAAAILLATAVGSALGAGPDSAPLEPIQSLDLQDVKVQWFSKGEEELPAWINAHFQVGPFGAVSGRVTETDLAQDGTDEDGDPSGFNTLVFDTADGTLRGVSLGARLCTFTTVFKDKASGQATYALHPSESVAGEWQLSVVQKSEDGLSVGRNRFPLSADPPKNGALFITTEASDDGGDGTSPL